MTITLNTTKLVPSFYVPESQKGEEEPAKFRLLGLTKRQYMEVMLGDGKTDERGNLVLTARGVDLALQYGLRGWEGITDISGAPLPFTARNAEHLPIALRMELVGEILQRSHLTETEEKN
jgi:hypothetical protein